MTSTASGGARNPSFEGFLTRLHDTEASSSVLLRREGVAMVPTASTTTWTGLHNEMSGAVGPSSTPTALAGCKMASPPSVPTNSMSRRKEVLPPSAPLSSPPALAAGVSQPQRNMVTRARSSPYAVVWLFPSCLLLFNASDCVDFVSAYIMGKTMGHGPRGEGGHISLSSPRPTDICWGDSSRHPGRFSAALLLTWEHHRPLSPRRYRGRSLLTSSFQKHRSTCSTLGWSL
jgi:hypothetical protein